MAEGLVIIDVQKDFTPGGALGVPEGDAVIEPLNRLARAYDTVFATRDWHPPDHHSFKEEGGPWPTHCVQHTPGGELDSRVARAEIDEIVDKLDRSVRAALDESSSAPHVEPARSTAPDRTVPDGGLDRPGLDRIGEHR